MICKTCGKMVLPHDGHIIDYEFHCNKCTAKCTCCGEYVLADETHETADSEIICDTCYDESYGTCEYCGGIHHQDELTWIEDENIYVCEHCRNNYYYECEYCQKYFSRNRVNETYDHKWVCNSCREAHYYFCDDCGYAVFEDESYYNERTGNDYCPDCKDNHNDSIYSYHGYSNFVKLKTFSEDSPDEYLGLEIEVSGDSGYAEDFLGFVPDAVLMRDGSIEDDGFEIVTHPMTRNYIKEEFLPDLEKGMTFLNDNGFKGHNCGGIHIHVSREIFTKEMLCVLRNVLYSEDEKDFEIWKAITQRRTSQIEQWCNYKDAISCCDILSSDNDYPALVDKRYTALNYDSRTLTYEFRIFNSNTRIERIRKNIQTVYSLIDYAKFRASRYIFADTEGYIDFVIENKENYPDLHSFIYEMGIVQRLEEERIAA